MKKWEILESKIIVQNQWITIKSDRCITQRGIEIPEYYWLEGNHYVVIVGTTNDNKVVMVEQYRHGINEILLEYPAGLIEEGEDIVEAARRELLEETGYYAQDIVFERVLYPHEAISNKKGYLFFARNLVDTGHQILDETEEIDIRLVDFDQLDDMIEKGELIGAYAVASTLLAIKKRDWFLE